jgi:hypothetical protein
MALCAGSIAGIKERSNGEAISMVWPERRPWIADPWYIAMPADAIFALVRW